MRLVNNSAPNQPFHYLRQSRSKTPRPRAPSVAALGQQGIVAIAQPSAAEGGPPAQGQLSPDFTPWPRAQACLHGSASAQPAPPPRPQLPQLPVSRDTSPAKTDWQENQKKPSRQSPPPQQSPVRCPQPLASSGHIRRGGTSSRQRWVLSLPLTSEMWRFSTSYRTCGRNRVKVRQNQSHPPSSALKPRPAASSPR